MKVAKNKVWRTDKGKLVPDGDPEASILVAIPGQQVPNVHVEHYENYEEHFEDVNPSEPPRNIPQPDGPDRKPGYTNVGKGDGQGPKERVIPRKSKGDDDAGSVEK